MVVCYFCNSENICARYRLNPRLVVFSCKKCIPAADFVRVETLPKSDLKKHKKHLADAEKNSIKWASAD
jgi:hypothetical protein